MAQIEAGHVRGKVIDIPAIAGEADAVGRQPGEYLWDEPGGYNYGRFLRDRQRETSPMMWAALFQQKPAPEDGDYFKAEWIRSVDIMPDRDTLRVYGASDFAVTADGSDWTVLQSSGSITPARFSCSTYGASRHPLTFGWRRFAT